MIFNSSLNLILHNLREIKALITKLVLKVEIGILKLELVGLCIKINVEPYL